MVKKVILIVLFAFVITMVSSLEQEVETEQRDEEVVEEETIIYEKINGMYLIGEGAKLCESGYFCPGDGKRYECPDGTYSRRRQRICEKCGCTVSNDCWKGDQIDNATGIQHYAGECKEKSTCKGGYGYDEVKNSCQKCYNGLYSEGGKSECKRCENRLVPNRAQDGCEECPIGSIEVMGICFTCQPGAYHNLERNQCEVCPEGWVQPDEGQTECIKCPDGYVSNGYFTECVEPDKKENILIGKDMKKFWKSIRGDPEKIPEFK